MPLSHASAHREMKKPDFRPTIRPREIRGCGWIRPLLSGHTLSSHTTPPHRAPLKHAGIFEIRPIEFMYDAKQIR